MALTARGDERAFEALYDRFRGLVFGLVLNVLGDRSSAEDVTLDVFTQVWKHAVLFQPHRASVKTWVASIARHKAIDELRRRRTRLDQAMPRWAVVQPSDLADPHAMETLIEDRDLQARIRAAIASLPDEQREALSLAYFRGYSHNRIAEALDRPLGSVKTHIRKAMQRLREIFGHET